ncbi:MAG: 4Fe-4S binding protein [Phycisphaerae bacterium]|nr:4Fe-4S binding protein [Phycisphaerae bacterium]
MAKAITVDINKCLACKSCEIACALAHSESGVLEDAISEHPAPRSRVAVEAAGEFGVPMQCRHCEDAPCITVCPTKAIARQSPESPVLIDQDLCIGCKFCLVVCPFGVIGFSGGGKMMVKCDLCIERLTDGRQPACVEACPTKALMLADEKDLATDNRRLAARELVASVEKSGKKRRSKENTQ